MTPDRDYATARQLIDPAADYTVHVRKAAGRSPPTPTTGNCPAWMSYWRPAASCAPGPPVAW
ncbi:hypothetical protein ABZS79_34330 [Streptomyces griseoloalbus]|uniref:hypothetical protein n=1 Tax=Streptomyces griseoloalbus TaxID=67303 RepID=UPI0033A507A5